MDLYRSFEALARDQTEGVDYIIIARQASSAIAIIAPHAGGIEPGTGDIADAIAADRYCFGAFKGIKETGNADLHIGSDRFDEPILSSMAGDAHVVVTIHGCCGETEQVYVGGRHEDLKQRFVHALKKAGFHAEESLRPGLKGKSRGNLCNRCRTGRGVQIEISKGLREHMVEGLGRRLIRKKTAVFYRFVHVIQAVLDDEAASFSSKAGMTSSVSRSLCPNPEQAPIIGPDAVSC
ncbi:MAG: hypothetical protein B5M55_01415 [Desulfococcus sp. 4484_242]|nr:MAG: hypothetical protein B5M55_01415 [Desulfococcus sp. 4484_242]